ncbi:hypothetical protein LQ327_27360 [Actinomycetospora endophytica]|uniref:DUF4129 domain-containing protein n=1 Tax=Actinomycetospora endophytica TaxID=2291215 RepID=A0ABS8PFQ4_9PSEU|nr:hypothetical protein [Actinomycetospora endophytica]MCD2197095.1 hypothetical protein [Actinomycetospora endophytica]
MTDRTTPLRRTAVPWLYGLAVLLTVLSPVVFLGVWVAEGTMDGLGAALLAAVVDLVAAVIAAGVATVMVTRRGVRRVRSVVVGHPDGRAGRLAAHGSARWTLARDRFAALQREYAGVESDPREVAARPALVDVSVPATGRFVEALAVAQGLATPTEPADPHHREQFTAAVDRAVATWDEARRNAEALAPQPAPEPAPTLAPGASPAGQPGADRDEYAAVADAVRQAAARGMRDLRDRMRA